MTIPRILYHREKVEKFELRILGERKVTIFLKHFLVELFIRNDNCHFSISLEERKEKGEKFCFSLCFCPEFGEDTSFLFVFVCNLEKKTQVHFVFIFFNLKKGICFHFSVFFLEKIENIFILVNF